MLNVPASTTWSWDDLTAVPLAGAPGRGLSDVASMNIGRATLGPLALALYVPVLTGLALSRAWRLTWAGRAAGLVVVFGGLAVLQDRDALPFRVPEIGVLLVPVALGLALAAACAVASFASDVAGGRFGWRQPLGVLSIAAVLCGAFPFLVTLTDGAWFAPRTTMMSLLAPRIAADDFGDFRVLYIGDPRVLPAAPHDLGDGIAYALTAPGVPSIVDRWAAPGSAADDELAQALDDIAGGATQRGGRLLAPYAIRYIVVPNIDGGESTAGDPLPPPAGLTDAFGAQLDLRRLFTSPSFDVFENSAAFPGVAAFTGPLADATAAAGPAELVRRDLSDAPAVLAGDARPIARRPVTCRPVSSPSPSRSTSSGRSTSTVTRCTPGLASGCSRRSTSPRPAPPSRATRRRRPAMPSCSARPLLWVAALDRGESPARPRVDRPPAERRRAQGPVIELADAVELPSEAGEVPVMVAREPVGRGRRRTLGATVREPLYRADDETARAAWVDEMFAGDDDGELVGDRAPTSRCSSSRSSPSSSPCSSPGRRPRPSTPCSPPSRRRGCPPPRSPAD